MSVVAQIQTVEEIYGLVWTAVEIGSRWKPTTRAGMGCFVHTDWAGIRKGSFAYSATNTAARAEADSTRWMRLQTGVVLDKLSRVKLLEDAWRTAPNHSRPASCVAEADSDAEDHPERVPQKGH